MKLRPMTTHFNDCLLVSIGLLCFLTLTFKNFALAETDPLSSSFIHDYKIEKILSLSINSSINPATLNYLSTAITEAPTKGHHLILIKMNTPGGLVSTTKDILTLFGNSDIPILVWITPEGASATSAGAIISAGAHLLFMSHGTNIGAATPITLGGDSLPNEKDKDKDKNIALEEDQNDLRKKAINDLVALVQSLSKTRNRNGDAFAEMIRNAKSFPAEEAEEKGLINGVSNQLEDIWKKIHFKSILIKGKTLRLLVPHPPQLMEQKMDLGQQILDIFANPSLAYILFILGAVLIYLELQAPGGFIAGSIGTICLLLAGISFQVLPINFGSLGLIILSFILFILEIFIMSYGLLSLAGIISLLFGSLFLFRSQNAYLEFRTELVYSIVGSVAFFLAVIAIYLAFAIKKNKKSPRNKYDLYGILGQQGIVVEEIHNQGNIVGKYFYQVKIMGELWNASSTQPCSVGDFVQIIELDKQKLMLQIKKTL